MGHILQQGEFTGDHSYRHDPCGLRDYGDPGYSHASLLKVDVVPGVAQLQQQAERERAEHEQRRSAHAGVEHQLLAYKSKVRTFPLMAWVPLVCLQPVLQ